MASFLAWLPAKADDQASEDESGMRVTWRRFGVWDYVATATVLASSYVVEFQLSGPSSASWTEPFPVIDDPVRNAFRAETRHGREQADTLSDYFWHGSTLLAVLDVAIAPLVRGADFDTVVQMESMNLQSLSLASLVTILPHKLIGRRRPNALGCKDDPEYDEQCGTKAQFSSFYGGHTAGAVTAAGLLCAHHLHGHVYGDRTADAVACAGALTIATSVPYFRIRADRHWVSDNIVGYGAGLGVGYALPTLLYYTWPRSPTVTRRDRDTGFVIVPNFDSGRLGLSVAGWL